MIHAIPIPDYATRETAAALKEHNSELLRIEAALQDIRQREERLASADMTTAPAGELATEREAVAGEKKKHLTAKIEALQGRLKLLAALEAERAVAEGAAAPAIDAARQAARTALTAAGYGRYFGDPNPNVRQQAENWLDLAAATVNAKARHQQLREERVNLVQLRQITESDIRQADEATQAAIYGRGLKGYAARLLVTGEAR